MLSYDVAELIVLELRHAYLVQVAPLFHLEVQTLRDHGSLRSEAAEGKGYDFAVRPDSGGVVQSITLVGPQEIALADEGRPV